MQSSTPRAFALPSKRHLIAIVLAVALAAGLGANVRPAHAAEAPVDLGAADSYGVLGGQEVTNTGPSVIGGNLGVNPGTSVTGFPLGIVGGSIRTAGTVALEAQTDLTTAYLDADGRQPTAPATNWTELGNKSFTAGVYSGGALSITDDVTLVGDATSVFIFQASSSLITASGSRVLLSGLVNPCNVFWQVETSASLGTGSAMVGTVMALTSITAQTGAAVNGRLLARNGTVTLDTNAVSGPDSCTAATVTPADPSVPVPPVQSAPPATAVPGEATFAG